MMYDVPYGTMFVQLRYGTVVNRQYDMCVIDNNDRTFLTPRFHRSRTSTNRLRRQYHGTHGLIYNLRYWCQVHHVTKYIVTVLQGFTMHLWNVTHLRHQVQMFHIMCDDVARTFVNRYGSCYNGQYSYVRSMTSRLCLTRLYGFTFRFAYYGQVRYFASVQYFQLF